MTAAEAGSAAALLAEFRAQRGCFRVILIACLLIGSAGGLYGGIFLAHEVRHWLAWVFSALVLEPAGIACLLALVTIAVPDSIAADFLGWSIRRAKRAAILVGLVYAGIVIALIAFVFWEWLSA